MTIHVVRAGESVYLLSQRYQVPVEVIERDNGIGQDGRLAVGQALFIRSGAQTRVVQPGDSWRALAEQTGQSVRQLLQKNPGLSEQSPPPPGTVLVVAQPEPELGAMRINGYVYPFVDRGVYTKTLPFVSFITLFTYGFTPEGELVLLDDEELIALAAESDVPAYLHFSTLTPEGNFSNELAAALLRNPDLQETVLARLLALMQQKGYGGLDIDFEYVLPEDRENYIAFIQRATETMNAAGYEVIVALAPKTSADQPGLLYEAHDYAGLGAAANAVLLMTYEWGYTYGPPMAVAPINQVRRVLEYAVTEIPPEKIYMGMPNYGYDWTLPYVQGESRARSLGNQEAVELAIRVGAPIEYDEVAQSPFFRYFDERGAEHEVWFEDARSVEAKARLAAEFGFLGLGFWNLMKFFPASWAVLDTLFTLEQIS